MGELITFVGDSHGQAGWLNLVIRTAAREGSHLLLALGDFGLWPGGGGERFLDDVERHLTKHDSTMLWIDGNHDWHDRRLEFLPENDGLVTIRPHLRYIPRGTVFSLPGAPRCLAVGGAVSIDKEWRTEGVNWWATEALQPDDVGRCMAAGEVDLVVSHDAPLEVQVGRISFPEGDAHRQLLSQIRASARPRWWWGGHWHERLSQLSGVGGFTTRFEVLHADVSQNKGLGWAVVDSDVFALDGDDPTVTPPPGEFAKVISARHPE